jgi:hypothetical protein
VTLLPDQIQAVDIIFIGIIKPDLVTLSIVFQLPIRG